MKIGATIYMDKREITPWVESWHVTQEPHTLYGQADITLRGWYAIDLNARWDIYATLDPATPRSSLLLSGGVIPPDRQPKTVIDRGNSLNVPVTTVQLFGWVWLAQRRTPRQTIVIASTRSDARLAVERYEQDAPVGRYQIVIAKTMHAAVQALAPQAGFNVELRCPDYNIAPTVIDPKASVWEAIRGLIEGMRPEMYYRHMTNTVLLADRVGRELGVGPDLNLSAASMKGLTATSLPYRQVRRVLIQVPSWP